MKKVPVKSQTRENVKRKRRRIWKRYIEIFFRFCVFLVVAGLLATAVGWLGLQAYRWVDNTYSTYAQFYEEYKQRRELRAQSFDPRFDGYTNVLLVGLDTGMEDNVQQADTILLLSLKNDTGEVRLMNIPRYTLVDIPGIKEQQRIANAYIYGGIPLLDQRATQLLNVTMHHYVVMDTSTLAQIIDIMGGIDLYVEADMDYDDPEGNLYIHIPKGYQKLDGDTAQKYLRYSSDDLGVLGRSKRQQSFLKAFYEQLLRPEVLPKVPAIINVCEANVKTSIEMFDSAHLTNLLRKIDQKKPLMMDLPGYRDKNGSWVCDKDITDEKVQELFPVENTEDN